METKTQAARVAEKFGISEVVLSQINNWAREGQWADLRHFVQNPSSYQAVDYIVAGLEKYGIASYEYGSPELEQLHELRILALRFSSLSPKTLLFLGESSNETIQIFITKYSGPVPMDVFLLWSTDRLFRHHESILDRNDLSQDVLDRFVTLCFHNTEYWTGGYPTRQKAYCHPNYSEEKLSKFIHTEYEVDITDDFAPIYHPLHQVLQQRKNLSIVFLRKVEETLPELHDVLYGSCNLGDEWFWSLLHESNKAVVKNENLPTEMIQYVIENYELDEWQQISMLDNPYMTREQFQIFLDSENIFVRESAYEKLQRFPGEQGVFMKHQIAELLSTNEYFTVQVK